MTLLEFYEAKRPRSYETNWHHRWICRVLETAAEQRQNAIIELPPRHGKSELSNCYFPAWRFETHYDSMFGLITNSDSLGKKFSSACRNLVSLPLEVDRDSQWKIKGLESLNFSYMAAGIRGQITGHGFDTLLLDDLLKSGAEAKSDVVRDSVWDNMASAAINRLTPDGIIVAMQARLHQEDTIGKLLGLEHLKFLHLHLPAINEGNGAWFRNGYTGEEVWFPPYAALWPTRYSREKLDSIKATVSQFWWNAQYMAVPSMGDLAYLDMEKCPVYRSTQVERLWIAVDAANTETKEGSFTAFVCLGLFGGTLKCLAVRRGRWRQDVMQQQLAEFYDHCTRLVGLYPEAVIVERAAGGYGLIDFFAGRLPVVPVIPQGSKEERCGAVCWIVNRGQVALPEAAPWLAAFKQECADFPLASQKDMVDAFVHALSYALRPSEFKLPERVVGVAELSPGADDQDSDLARFFIDEPGNYFT